MVEVPLPQDCTESVVLDSDTAPGRGSLLQDCPESVVLDSMQALAISTMKLEANESLPDSNKSTWNKALKPSIKHTQADKIKHVQKQEALSHLDKYE
jgi:hypothetical protein